MRSEDVPMAVPSKKSFDVPDDRLSVPGIALAAR
jgi:hypothetical protein